MAESSPLTWSVHLTDEGATEALGRALAHAWQACATPAALVTLTGDLGAGKTSLVRGLLRGLGHTGVVPSPTYALLEPYQFDEVEVSHLDLYRLADASELEFLGWRDLGHTLRLVEWPERAEGLESQADLSVGLRIAGAGRDAMIEARTRTGEGILRGLLGN